MNSYRFFKSKVFVVFSLALVVFGLARLYYTLTDDFRLANITHEVPFQEDWQVASYTSAEQSLLADILSQKFTYLAKGAQSYVFLSADGKYVIKFFKFKHLRPNWFFSTLASYGLFTSYHEKLAARKERKLWGVFRAYKLAYDINREESGLLFIQLNSEYNPKNQVTVIDKIGIERTIDLEHITFIIQQRGESLRVVLEDTLNQQNLPLAQAKIGQIFDLYAKEYSRGFYDHDHGVMRNLGFAGDEPIHLDVGKLYPAEEFKNKERAKEDAILVGRQIQMWIDKNYPQYKVQMAQFIDEKIHSLYD